MKAEETNSATNGITFKFEVMGEQLTFKTHNKLFSPYGIDEGTLAMLSITKFNANDKVLDLGCGYGVVGLVAAKKIGCKNIIMCDISDLAVKCTKENASLNGLDELDIRQSDGLSSISENDFTLILSNPPYHTDFSVAKHFIEDGFKRLAVGGKLVMVTKRRDWYKNKLISTFGGVKINEVNDYFVFVAEKRVSSFHTKKREKQKNKLSRKLQRKQNLLHTAMIAVF